MQQNLFRFVWGRGEAGSNGRNPNKQTNWELRLSQVWNELGQDLIPPQSLIEAAYVCHELLSSNIWGFSRPSNSWGLISWDLPSSVQESGRMSRHLRAERCPFSEFLKKNMLCFATHNHLPSCPNRDQWWRVDKLLFALLLPISYNATSGPWKNLHTRQSLLPKPAPNDAFMVFSCKHKLTCPFQLKWQVWVRDVKVGAD